MKLYSLLMQTRNSTKNPLDPVTIVFQKMKAETSKVPIILEADSPEEALAIGKTFFGFPLSNFLAVEPYYARGQAR